MSKVRFFLKRITQTVFLLWLVLTFLFFLFRLMPGDVSDILLYQGADPDTVAEFEESWGLNDPLYVQYFQYIYNFILLDPGYSVQTNEPVWDFVKMNIFNTFILAAPAITLAYILGAIIGTVTGTKRGGKLEKFVPVPLLTIGAIPEFFLAILMIIVFAGFLGWFPTSSMIDPAVANQYSDDPWWRIYFTQSFAMHFVLPFTTVVLRYLFLPSLIMRTSVVEVLGQDFIFYKRVTGLPKSARLKSIAKHSSLPVITLYPISMARAIGGLVLIETVFNWPGMGYALVQAVLARDFATVQFVFFVIAAFVIVANFVIDIFYSVIDPRVSLDD
ncbi:ABC transporter permease [Natrialba sp. INN-245]|uniref:ABC transporter permease subunit n=1 Tax=Natrialba sp. INN-245 TaxID=2690967 RepID=UPI00130FF80C|nr:ABC transporter permease subunit [Natrialba sp. INN-245]